MSNLVLFNIYSAIANSVIYAILCMLIGCPTVYAPPDILYRYEGIANNRVHIETVNTAVEKIDTLYFINTNNLNNSTIYSNANGLTNIGINFDFQGQTLKTIYIASASYNASYPNAYGKLNIGFRNQWIETEVLPSEIIDLDKSNKLIIAAKVSSRNRIRYMIIFPWKEMQSH